MPAPRKPVNADDGDELQPRNEPALRPRALGRAGPGRFRRALRRAAMVAGLVTVFAGASACAVLLSLDLPPMRRVAARITNDVLAPLFEGRIMVDAIDHLSLSGVEFHTADVLTPDGVRTIHASGVRALIDLRSLLKSLVFGKDDVDVLLPLVQIANADVEIERGKDGRFTLEESLSPRQIAAAPPAGPVKPGRRPRLRMLRIEIHHAWAHGDVAPPRALDADVNRIVASLVAGEGSVTVDVEQTGVIERRLLPAPISGSGQYHLYLSHEGIRMGSEFEGEVGSVEVIAKADLDGKVVHAIADFPRVSPDDLATITTRIPFGAAISGHAEIAGELPDVDVSATLGSPSERGDPPVISVDGKLSLASPVRLVADVHARNLDPSRLSAVAPTMSISADARVAIEAGETLRVRADARSEPTTLENQRIPGALVSAVLDRGVVFGQVTADEEGAPADATFTFAPLEGLRFDAAVVVPSLGAAPRFSGPVSGSARAHVRGTLRGEELDAEVDGSASAIKVAGGVELERATVNGRVTGPLGDLSIDAAVQGSNMRAGGYDFDRVEGRASGPVRAIRIGAVLDSTVGTTLEAEGALDAAAHGLRGVKVDLRKDGTEMKGTIASITAKGGGVAIDGAELRGEGIGAIESTLKVSGADVTGTLKGQAMNLEKLTTLAGLPYRVRGIADVDIDIERGAHGRNGHVLVALENGEMPLVSGISASIATRFKDDEVEADGLVRIVAGGRPEATAAKPETVAAKSEVRTPKPETPAEERCDGTIAEIHLSDGRGLLRGPLLEPKTWSEITGDARIAAEDWNLRCLARLFPVGLPISNIRGSATTRFALSRPAGQHFPSIKDLYFRTRQLEVAGLEENGTDTPAWESRAIDVQLRGGVDGATGRTTADLTLFDGDLLADASLDASLDLNTLANDPARRVSSLRTSELALDVSVPRRSFESLHTLPSFARDLLPSLAGEIRLNVAATGTADKPLVVARASGFHVAPASASSRGADPWALPVDVETVGTYDGQRATLDAHVSREDIEIANASGELDVALHDLLARKPGEALAWTGGFSAKLEGVPLADVPFFSDRDVGGYVRGTLSAARLNDHPTLAADLELPSLRIGPDLSFDKASLSLQVNHRAGASGDTAIASADFVGKGGGRMHGLAFAGILWKEGFLPTIDQGAAADLFVKLQNFRLATFLPLTGGALSKLDGHVDGSVRVGWRRVSQGDDGSVAADLTVSDGVFDVPVLGEEFRGAHAHVSADATGKVRVDDIHAEGLTGAIRGTAEARFAGLKFVDAGGTFAIKEGEEIPITLEGMPIGEARGQVDIHVVKKGSDIDIATRVERAHLELPTSTARRDAQSLDDNPDVTVSHPLGAPKEKARQADTRIVVNLDLRDVRIEQHGAAGFDMTFASSTAAPLRAELTDRLRMYGDIQFTRGLFDVLGKRFQIEQGIVRMKPEETGNPFVNVTARWDSPEGTRIYVDYVGDLMPITSNKLKFRSSPPRPQSELIAILLGGGQEQEGGVGTTDPNALGAGPGAGIVGNVASGQVNALLQGISPLKGFSTGISSTQEGALRTSVSYQLGDTVTASAAYQGESTTAPLVQNAATGVCISDKPGAACAEGSLEWHFRPNWSVRATVGNVSDQTNSELNLLWQRRY